MTDAFGIPNVPNDKKTVFGLDPLVASQWTTGGNSYLARRARVEAQDRDKYGKWVEENSFISFELRMPDGTVTRQIGRYAGSARGDRMMRVIVTEPRDGAPAGAYTVNGRNAITAKAFLSLDTLTEAGVDVNGKKVGSTLDQDIQNLDDSYQGPADEIDNDILQNGLTDEEKARAVERRASLDASRPYKSYNVVDDEGNRIDDPADAEDPFPGDITADTTELTSEQEEWALRNVESHYRIPEGGRFLDATEEDIRSDLEELRTEREGMRNAGVNTAEIDARIAWAEEELWAHGHMTPDEQNSFLLARAKDMNGVQEIISPPVAPGTQPTVPTPAPAPTPARTRLAMREVLSSFEEAANITEIQDDEFIAELRTNYEVQRTDDSTKFVSISPRNEGAVAFVNVQKQPDGTWKAIDPRPRRASEQLLFQGSRNEAEYYAMHRINGAENEPGHIPANRSATPPPPPSDGGGDGGDGGDGGGPTPPSDGGGPDQPSDPFLSLESEIDRSALTSKQKKALDNLLAWKAKALEARSGAALDDDAEDFERATALAERIVDAINSIARAQMGGDAGRSYIFSGSESARFENMRIIPGTVKTAIRDNVGRDNDGNPLPEELYGTPYVTNAEAIFIAKNGIPYKMNFTPTGAYVYNFNDDGSTSSYLVASCGTNVRAGTYGDQREPHLPRSSSIGMIQVHDNSVKDTGLAGFMTLLNRWASETSGRPYTHSNTLYEPGNYYSKVVSPRLEQQHRGQRDKFMDVQNPNADILKAIKAAGNAGDLSVSRTFWNSLLPFSQGSSSNQSPLWDANFGRGLIKLVSDIRKDYIDNGRNGQVGVDFPEFATDSVTGENEDWTNYDIQTYLLKTGYIGGPTKEEALAYIDRITDGLDSISNGSSRHRSTARSTSASLKKFREYIANPDLAFDDSTRIPEPEPFDANKAITWSSPYAGGSDFNNFLIPSGYPRVPTGTAFAPRPSEPSPIQLANDHDEATLVSALRDAIVGRKSNDALLDNGTTTVQTGAIVKALEEKGLDATNILAGIYDEVLGDGRDDNRQRLDATRAKLRDIRQDMRAITSDLDNQVDPIPFADLSGGYDASTEVLSSDSQERRDDDTSLEPSQRIQEPIRNDVLALTNGVEISQEKYTPQVSARSWLISGVTDSPRVIARNFSTQALKDALSDALSKDKDKVTLGFARGGTLAVRLEAIRDALQHQGVDTNEFIDSLPNRSALMPTRVALTHIKTETPDGGGKIDHYSVGTRNGRKRISTTSGVGDTLLEVSSWDRNDPSFAKTVIGKVTERPDGKFEATYTKRDGTEKTEVYDERNLAAAALQIAISKENGLDEYLPSIDRDFEGRSSRQSLMDLDSRLSADVETESDQDGTARIFKTRNLNNPKTMRVEEDSATGTLLWRDPEDTSGNFASVTTERDADGNETFVAESPAFRVRFNNRDAAIQMADGYAARKIFALESGAGFITEVDPDTGRRNGALFIDFRNNQQNALAMSLPDDYEEVTDGTKVSRIFRNVTLSNGAIVTVRSTIDNGRRQGNNDFVVRTIDFLDDADQPMMTARLKRQGSRAYGYELTTPAFNNSSEGNIPTSGSGYGSRTYANTYTRGRNGAVNEERAFDSLRMMLTSGGISDRDTARLLHEQEPALVPVADTTPAPTTAPTVSSNPQEIRQPEDLSVLPVGEERVNNVLGRMTPIDLTGADFGGRVGTRGITVPTMVTLPDGRRFKMKKYDADPAGFQRVAENEAAVHAMFDILGIPATSGGLGRMPDGTIVFLDPIEPDVVDMGDRRWYSPPSGPEYDRVRQDNILNKLGMVLLGATDHDPNENWSNVFYTRDTDGTIRSRVCDGGGIMLFAAGSFTGARARLKDNHIFPGTRRYGNDDFGVDGLMSKTRLDMENYNEIRALVEERILPLTPADISRWASAMYSNPDDVARATATLTARRSQLLAKFGINDTATPVAPPLPNQQGTPTPSTTPATPQTQPGGSGGGRLGDPENPGGPGSDDRGPLGSDREPIYQSWTVQELPNGTKLGVGVLDTGERDLMYAGYVIGRILNRDSGDVVVEFRPEVATSAGAPSMRYTAIFNPNVNSNIDVPLLAQRYLSQLSFAGFDIDNMFARRRNLFSDDPSVITDAELVFNFPLGKVYMDQLAVDATHEDRENARQSLALIDRSSISPEDYARYESIIDGYHTPRGEIFDITNFLDELPRASTPTTNPTPSNPSTNTPAPTASSSVNTPVTPNADGSVNVSSLRVGDYISGVGRVIMLRNDPETGNTYTGVLAEDGSTQFITLDSNETFFINNSDPDAANITDITGGTNRITALHDAGNATLNDVRAAYPDAIELPNGDLLITQREFKYADRGRIIGKTYRFEVIVHRTGTEEFSAYSRMIEIDPDTRQDIPGQPTMAAGATALAHSSQALLNRIPQVIRGINRVQPGNWFNNQGDRKAEVIDPRTGAPIHPDLLPTRFDEEIGNTGIQRTGDGMRDALIEYIADLIDNNAADADIMRRITESGLLSQNQVLDVIERYEAHLRRPGVNIIPYVARDKENIIRVGDIVHHHNKDTGEIDREGGRVVRRLPIKIYNKSSGTYEYSDLVEVSFPNDRVRQYVSRNLSLVQRADGSPVEPLRTGNRPAPDPTPSTPPTGPTPVPDPDPIGGTVLDNGRVVFTRDVLDSMDNIRPDYKVEAFLTGGDNQTVVYRYASPDSDGRVDGSQNGRVTIYPDGTSQIELDDPNAPVGQRFITFDSNTNRDDMTSIQNLIDAVNARIDYASSTTTAPTTPARTVTAQDIANQLPAGYRQGRTGGLLRFVGDDPNQPGVVFDATGNLYFFKRYQDFLSNDLAGAERTQSDILSLEAAEPLIIDYINNNQPGSTPTTPALQPSEIVAQLPGGYLHEFFGNDSMYRATPQDPAVAWTSDGTMLFFKKLQDYIDNGAAGAERTESALGDGHEQKIIDYINNNQPGSTPTPSTTPLSTTPLTRSEVQEIANEYNLGDGYRVQVQPSFQDDGTYYDYLPVDPNTMRAAQGISGRVHIDENGNATIWAWDEQGNALFNEPFTGNSHEEALRQMISRVNELLNIDPNPIGSAPATPSGPRNASEDFEMPDNYADINPSMTAIVVAGTPAVDYPYTGIATPTGNDNEWVLRVEGIGGNSSIETITAGSREEALRELQNRLNMFLHANGVGRTYPDDNPPSDGGNGGGGTPPSTPPTPPAGGDGGATATPATPAPSAPAGGDNTIGQLANLPAGYVMDTSSPGAYHIYRQEDPSSAPEVRITPGTMASDGSPGYNVEYLDGGTPVSSYFSLDEIGLTLQNVREEIVSRYDRWRDAQIQAAVDNGTPRFIAMLPTSFQNNGVTNNPENIKIRIPTVNGIAGGRAKVMDDGRWKAQYFEDSQGMVSTNLLAQYPVTEEQTFDTKDEAAEWLSNKIHDSYTEYLNANYPGRLPENYSETVLSNNAVRFSSTEDDKPRVEVSRTPSGEWQISAWTSNSDADNGNPAALITSVSDYTDARTRALDLARHPVLLDNQIRLQTLRNNGQRVTQTTFDAIAADDAFWAVRRGPDLIKPIPSSRGNSMSGRTGAVDPIHGDLEVWELLVRQGMDGRPAVVASSNDLQGTPIVRGIGQAGGDLDRTRAQANQLAFSDAPYIGYGVFGNGIYTGDDVSRIQSFYAGNNTSSFVRMSVLPGARVLDISTTSESGTMAKVKELTNQLVDTMSSTRGITKTEARSMLYERFPWLFSTNGQPTSSQFLSYLAVMLGYDAIRVIGGGSLFGARGDTYVVLNRGMTQVVDNGFSPNAS